MVVTVGIRHESPKSPHHRRQPRQRALPLQTLIDQQGESKSALQIILEEAASAGIEESCVVVCPGDESAYAAASGALRDRVRLSPSAIARLRTRPCFAARVHRRGNLSAPRGRPSARCERPDGLRTAARGNRGVGRHPRLGGAAHARESSDRLRDGGRSPGRRRTPFTRSRPCSRTHADRR